MAQSDDFCDDFWDTLEDVMRGFDRLRELHDDSVNQTSVLMDRTGFRAAMYFYLGADVARAITDEEIRKVNQDMIGTIYPQGREPEKERPLDPVLEAAIHLTRILDRRMRSPEAWGLLKKARNNLRWAVGREEELRAKPSITERIRQAKEEKSEGSGSARQFVRPRDEPETGTAPDAGDGQAELAGTAAEGETAAN